MEELGTQCSFYEEKDANMRRLIREIMLEKDGYGRVSKSYKLMRELSALLTCQKYDCEDPNCTSCRTVAFWQQNILETFFVLDETMTGITYRLERISSSLVKVAAHV